LVSTVLGIVARLALSSAIWPSKVAIRPPAPLRNWARWSKVKSLIAVHWAAVWSMCDSTAIGGLSIVRTTGAVAGGATGATRGAMGGRGRRRCDDDDRGGAAAAGDEEGQDGEGGKEAGGLHGDIS
jgi:hypothetical protein